MTLLTPDPGLLGNTIINNRYQLEDYPKEGMFAYVYQAFDNQLERQVAVKVLKPLRTPNSEWVDHFRNEATALAQLENPYIVRVIEVDTDTNSGLDYLAMEWLGGQSLAEWRRTVANPSIENMLDIAIDICKGLQAMHDRELMHGDITPRNVYLEPDNAGWRAKLIDLGLMWQLKHTAPAELDGTLAYAAPEQLTSDSIDYRSDIYSLGALLFFLFSGQYYLPTPLINQNDDREQVRQVILSEPARSLQSVLGACNNELNNLLLAMLEKDLNARHPATVAEVERQLETILHSYEHETSTGSGRVKLERPSFVDNIELELELFIADRTAEDIRTQLISQMVSAGHLPESALRAPDQAIVPLLFQGGEAYDCYFYNEGSGVYESEHRLRIALATDSNNPHNLYYTEALRGSLVLECLKTPRYPNSLVVRRIYEASTDMGLQNNINIPARLKFTSRGAGSSTAQNIPDPIIELLKTKPKEIEADAQVMQRLGYWRSHVNAWKRLVSEREFEVEFVDYRWRNAPNNTVLVWFYLNEEINIPWERLRASVNEPLYLRHYAVATVDDENSHDILDSEDILLGIIERLDENTAAVQVRLDAGFLAQADSDEMFPQPGYLACKMLPDLAPIRQQAEALEALGRGRTPNSRLSRFIFDATQAAMPGENGELITLRRDMLLLDRLDAEQRKAIEKALNAPDLFLIQGLAGTGKSTLIGELCYQFANRDQRILVVTQTGEMVDRLLTTLPHHPSIRPLRVGKSRTGFTREAIVNTWFRRMALDASERLANRDHQQEMAAYLFADQGRLQLYVSTLEQDAEQRQQLEVNREQAHKLLDPVQNALATVQEREHELYTLTEHLLAASQAIKNDEAAEFEPTPNSRWRSEIFNVVMAPEYQAYLNRLVEAINLVEQAQPGGTKELLEEALNTQDYLMIQRLRQGVQEARNWAHRVTSVLSVGPLLAQSLEQSANLLGILQSDVDSLLKLASLYDDIQNQYLAGTELALASVALKNMTNPMPRIDKVVNSYQTYMNAFRKVQETQELYKQAVEQEAALAAEVDSKQSILTWQTQVNDLQQRPLQVIEFIKETAVELEQYASAKTTGSLASADNQALLTLQQSITDQRDLITQCQNIQSSMDEAMTSIGEWLLSGQTIALGEYLPNPLVKALEQHRWASEDPIYRAITEAYSICRGAIAELDRVIPSKYFLLNAKPDKLLSDRLRDLFDDKRQADKFNCVYPANINKFTQQLQRILSERLKNARTSRKADAQAWLPIVSEYYVIVGFEKLLSRQLVAHSARLAEPIVQQGRHRLVMHELLPRVIKEQQLELQRLAEQLDRMKTMLSAKAKRAEQQREQVTQKMDAHIEAFRSAIHQVETQLSTNIYAELQTLLDQINWKLTPDPVGAAALLEETLHQAHEAIDQIFAGHHEVLANARQELAEAQMIKAQSREGIQQAQKDMGQLKREIAAETETLKSLQASWQQWENIHQQTGIAAEIQSLFTLVSRGKSVQAILEIRDNIAQVYEQTHQALAESVQVSEARLAQKKATQTVNPDQLKAEMSQADIKRQSMAQNIQREMERIGGQRLVIALNGTRPPVDITPEALTAWQRLLDLINKLLAELNALPRYLDPLTVLDTLLDQLHILTVENAEKVKQLASERDLLSQRQLQATQQFEQYTHDVEMERTLWEEIYHAIPRHLLETLGPVQDIHYAGYVRKVMERACSDEWQQEWSRQLMLMAGLERLVQGWIARLGEQRSSDTVDLRELYLANVNVMGATYNELNQIGPYHREYRPFDVVIIDDAQRATPSELLLAMLKAHKVVLIGDAQQLPPMVGEQTLLEAVQSFNLSPSETEHLQQSYFSNLFNSAPQALKATLTHQYRMHYAIREVVNTLYLTELVGGHQREHGLILSAITPNISVIKISTPAESAYVEEKTGGSYRNQGEVETIERLLRQMNDAWMKQAEGGTSKSVGIITFYEGQARRLRSRLQGPYRALEIQIGTVDEFQSAEFAVILVSLVRQQAVNDLSRLTTSLSRASELLVVIGSDSATNGSYVYQQLLDTIQQEGALLDVSQFA
ncbi:MAG: protein kinase [Chloroflexi bacterium]|nr:protein kinase [Chloroflexota bacterium]